MALSPLAVSYGVELWMSSSSICNMVMNLLMNRILLAFPKVPEQMFLINWMDRLSKFAGCELIIRWQMLLSGTFYDCSSKTEPLRTDNHTSNSHHQLLQALICCHGSNQLPKHALFFFCFWFCWLLSILHWHVFFICIIFFSLTSSLSPFPSAFVLFFCFFYILRYGKDTQNSSSSRNLRYSAVKLLTKC